MIRRIPSRDARLVEGPKVLAQRQTGAAGQVGLHGFCLHVRVEVRVGRRTSTAAAAPVRSDWRSPLCPPLSCQHPLMTRLTDSCGVSATLGTAGSWLAVAAGSATALGATDVHAPSTAAEVPASSKSLRVACVLLLLLLRMAQERVRCGVKGR